MKRLLVINPNSSETVTEGIATALRPLDPMAAALGVRIDCQTLHEGPPGIESQAQADLVIAPLLARAAAAEAAGDVAGFVVACFGDPGLYALRDRTAKPVLGIQESAVARALTLGQSFGVIAILPASIPRHLRALGAMGVTSRLAGDRALGLGVAALADPAQTFERMRAVGQRLRDDDGADVLILGCAGMAQYRAPLEAALSLPVIDPCQAAVADALGRIATSQSHKIGEPHA